MTSTSGRLIKPTVVRSTLRNVDTKKLRELLRLSKSRVSQFNMGIKDLALDVAELDHEEVLRRYAESTRVIHVFGKPIKCSTLDQPIDLEKTYYDVTVEYLTT